MLYDGPMEAMDECIHPEDRKYTQDLLVQLEQASQPLEYTFRIILKDGGIRTCRSSLITEHDRKGTLEKMKGVVQDITEQKNLEDSLRESEIRYRTISEVTPDATFISCEDKVIFSNNSLVSLLRAQNLHALIGMNIFDFIHPDFHDTMKHYFTHLALGQRKGAIEGKFVRFDGTVIDVEVCSAPVIFGGKEAGIIVARDLTDRKAAEKDLRVQNEKLSKLNKAMVGREMKMIELKEKLQKLEQKMNESSSS